MNHGLSNPLFGIVALNLFALLLLLAVEFRARRRKPAEPELPAESSTGLDRWIAEVEGIEGAEMGTQQRPAFAPGGDFLPQPGRTRERVQRIIHGFAGVVATERPSGSDGMGIEMSESLPAFHPQRGAKP